MVSLLKNNFNFSQKLILLLLFLGSMNVGDLYSYFIFFAFIIYVIANHNSIKLDGLFFVLLLVSACYLIFYPLARYNLTTIIRQFTFPVCYLMGSNYIKHNDKTITRQRNELIQTYTVFVTMAMGAYIHFLLNMFNNVDSTSRNNVDIWTGGIISATGQACMAVMATGVFAALLFSERKPLIKVLALIGMITVFAYNLVLAGRTLIILMILLLAVAYVYSAKKAQIQRLGKVLIIPIIIGIIIYFIYSLNVFGVRDWIMDSNFYYRFNRMSFVDDARMNTRVIYISQMLRYPFGGGQMRREIGGYAHELYLDAYNDVGMIGYLLLIGFVVSSAVRVLKLVFKTNYDNDFKLLVLCVYIATIVEFHLEPIIQGVPWLFCAFCLFSGLIGSIDFDSRNAQNNVEEV